MAHYTITASELKFAVLDPSWRAKWLAGERPSTRTFSPPGTMRARGVRFQKEAEALVGWLTARDSLGAAAQIDSAAGLIDHLWATSLQALTDQLFQQGRGEEAAAFIARVRNFCTRLIDLKHQTERFENWQDIFVGAEQNLSGIPVRVGDRMI